MATGDAGPGGADFEIPGKGGASQPVMTLLSDSNAEREIRIVCAPDRMRAYVKFTPGPAFKGVTAGDLASSLKDCGIVFGHIESGLSLFAAIQSGPHPFDGYFQLARGTPMRHGENGSIEFHVQPAGQTPRYDETATGNMDFKQLNIIENCFAGQRVASLLPPGPGRPGRDVFGAEIPAEAGNALEIKTGFGVKIGSNGRDFTAENEGRLVYEDGMLSVSPTLEIGHDVDLRVGNIDFVGKVVIKGSLLDGFYVNGKRGVEVLGDMGAARITSEADVRLTGGVKGRSAAIITCRYLDARYLDDASVEASGNVVVDKEIVNSDIKALGRVSIPRGAIVGGSVCGFGGVEAGTTGSELGVATRILAGLDWTEENRKEEIRGKVAEYMETIQTAKYLLDPLFADPELKSRLGNEQKSLLFELVSELRDLRDNLNDLLRERFNIDSRNREGAVAMINVTKQVYMGVEACFNQISRKIADNLKGPVSLMMDPDAKAVNVSGLAALPPLRKNAPPSDGAEKAPVPEAES